MAMLNVRVPVINSCCFCVNLRTATLILASLGIFSHLYSALVIRQMPTTQGSFLYTIWIVYSYLSVILCGAGAFGVYRNKSKLLKAFAIYYWADLALGFILSIFFSVKAFHLEDSVCQELGNSANNNINLETCHQFYNNAALAVLVALGLSLVIRLHYSLAVWSYYRQATTTRYAHVEPSEDTDKLYEMEFE